MKYRPFGMAMWDFWCINTNNKIHGYHLNFLAENSPFTSADADWMGHAVSDDLIHWQECDRILPANKEKNAKDSEQKWTGCTVEKDGKYYLFYTMREQNNNQRIGLAVSDNLYDFEEYEGNPLLEPDSNLFLGYKTEKPWTNTVDCRDMVVIKDPKSGGYFGYFAVCANVSGVSPKGVIGYAYSHDLIHWEQRGIAFCPDFNGVIEVPDVYYLNGKWYLAALTGTMYGGRGVFHEDGLETGTIYAVSDAPDQPFVCTEDNVLMGGCYNSCGYSIRSVDYKGKKYALYTTKEIGADSISLPKRIDTIANGRLRLFYDELLKSLREKALCEKHKSIEITEQPQTSFAWSTKGGQWKIQDNSYSIKTDFNSWQIALLDAKCKNIELSADIHFGSARAAGFAVYSTNQEKQNKYIILAEKQKNRVMFTAAYEFSQREKRTFDFSNYDVFHLRILVVDNTCDIYINDILVMNTCFENLGLNTAGVFADDGKVEICNLEIYQLKD